mmetsp:Transcript_10066/g.26063  ORF Transcript_10066/g.26063 Transcript_10066/m.26063 type:complete len:210 (+) Transcript_10066:496-1125(+)
MKRPPAAASDGAAPASSHGRPTARRHHRRSTRLCPRHLSRPPQARRQCPHRPTLRPQIRAAAATAAAPSLPSDRVGRCHAPWHPQSAQPSDGESRRCEGRCAWRAPPPLQQPSCTRPAGDDVPRPSSRGRQHLAYAHAGADERWPPPPLSPHVRNPRVFEPCPKVPSAASPPERAALAPRASRRRTARPCRRCPQKCPWHCASPRCAHA